MYENFKIRYEFRFCILENAFLVINTLGAYNNMRIGCNEINVEDISLSFYHLKKMYLLLRACKHLLTQVWG